MNYDLTNIRSNELGFGALATLAARATADSDSRIGINLSAWFDANMAAPLGAVISILTDKLKTVQLTVEPSVQTILRKNRFLTNFGFRPHSDTYGTTLPYQRFKLSELGSFAEYLTTHLPGKGIPSMTSDLALAFQQSLYEIFNNAITHSGSDQGVFVCGQFFPIDHRLDISMADAGVGIPRKVNKGYHALLDDHPAFWKTLKKANRLDEQGNMKPAFALRVALTEGVTTKTGKTPGGGGLKLIKAFVQHNGGCIQIASGGAFWEFSKVKDTFNEFQSPFPGTVVNLEINTADTKSYCLASSPQ